VVKINKKVKTEKETPQSRETSHGINTKVEFKLAMHNTPYVLLELPAHISQVLQLMKTELIDR
jgi:hypothetical protein